jgi:competence protein ComEC
LASRIGLFLSLIFYGLYLTPDFFPELIVWNVGQGQWVTIVTQDACWHFDMGGEKANWRRIMAICRKRENRVSLSHWDMDHISFVSRARTALPRICRLNTPLGPAKNKKRRMVERLPECTEPVPFHFWEDAAMSTTNGLSRVVQWKGVVMPGDSSRREEKIWIYRLAGLGESKILVLGHHGSHTSTSRALLERLPKLRMAIASARYSRYGHPHRRVIQDLEDFKIPLLRTEEWGTIHIEL